MAKKKKDQVNEGFENVEAALSKTEQFIEDNQRPLLYAVVGIAVIVLIVIGYRNYIQKPKEIEAQDAMFMAEMYFAKDSINLALYGDNMYPGFESILNDYKRTKSGNLAHFYTGKLYMEQGLFNEAIDELKKFKSDDELVAPMAKGLIGDAYMELGDMDEALSFYKKAAEMRDNAITTPAFLLKVGMTFEVMGDYKKAFETYKEIKDRYPKCYLKDDIDKYIEKAKGLSNEA